MKYKYIRRTWLIHCFNNLDYAVHIQTSFGSFSSYIQKLIFKYIFSSRNVPYIDVAKGVDPEWYAATRTTALVVILLRYIHTYCDGDQTDGHSLLLLPD